MTGDDIEGRPAAGLVFVDAGDPAGLGRDFDYRLKLFLKRALRDFGLRCTSCSGRPAGMTSGRGRADGPHGSGVTA